MSFCNEKNCYCMSKPLAYQLCALRVSFGISPWCIMQQWDRAYYNNDDNTKKKKKKRRNFLYILASLKKQSLKNALTEVKKQHTQRVDLNRKSRQKDLQRTFCVHVYTTKRIKDIIK